MKTILRWNLVNNAPKRLTCSYLSSLPNVMDIMAVLPFILETSLIMIPNSDRSWFPQALSGGWDYSLDFLEVLKPVKGLTFRFCALRAYFASFASSSCPNCKRWKQCWGIYSFGSQRGRICISDLGTLWFLSRVFNLFAYRTLGDSTRELSFLFILLGVSAVIYATLIYLVEHTVETNKTTLNLTHRLNLE